MGYLWSSYQSDSITRCMLQYFIETVEDPEVKEVVQQALTISEKHIQEILTIFRNDRFPVPESFTEEDVNRKAKKLYTDEFILYYQWFIGKGYLNYSSIALNTVARKDVAKFYEDSTKDGLELVKKSRDTLLSKGLWIRPPYIPKPETIDFVEKQSFLHGWFGEQRPLLGIEIAHLFYNLMTNSVGLGLITSFLQVAKDEKVRNYFSKGMKICSKHVEELGEILKAEQLSVPSSWNLGVTTSTEPPFSDRLMLFFITLLNAQGISNYGIGLATSMRRDVGLCFTRLTAEVVHYAEDGTNLLIDFGWLEQPPKAPNRDQLRE